MLLCPRCALVGLLLTLVAFSGCDTNNPGRALDDLDGSYRVAELLFDPSAASLQDADVAARLSSDTQLEIFGRDGDAELTSRLETESGRTRTSLRATATRGRVTLEAIEVGDETELRRLLLPRTFSLTYDASNPNTLTATIGQTGVDLQAFDSQAYQGLRDVSGTLRIRLDRITN